jgi:hypothetical protein
MQFGILGIPAPFLYQNVKFEYRLVSTQEAVDFMARTGGGRAAEQVFPTAWQEYQVRARDQER